jgi:ribonucleoside-diphosphate reductase alpha chain
VDEVLAVTSPLAWRGWSGSAEASPRGDSSEVSRRELPPTGQRHFTRPGISPFDEITWELRDAIIQDYKGRTIFEQKNVEVPPTGP